MKILRSTIVVSVLSNGEMKTYNALPLNEFSKKCGRTRNHITALLNNDRLTKVHLCESGLERQAVFVLLDEKAENEIENFKRIDEKKKEKKNNL